MGSWLTRHDLFRKPIAMIVTGKKRLSTMSLDSSIRCLGRPARSESHNLTAKRAIDWINPATRSNVAALRDPFAPPSVPMSSGNLPSRRDFLQASAATLVAAAATEHYAAEE